MDFSDGETYGCYEDLHYRVDANGSPYVQRPDGTWRADAWLDEVPASLLVGCEPFLFGFSPDALDLPEVAPDALRCR